MTTTDPTALLAALEELHAFLWDEMEFFSDDTDAEHRWTTHALGQKHDDLVERFHDAYAAASPTLARALAIGTAWLAAEAEAEASIPKGRDDRLQGDALIQCGGYSWGDSAFFAETYRPAAWAHTRAATPEAALLALADALRKERGA